VRAPLAAFLYTASIIFLMGVEIDELLRKDASAGEKGSSVCSAAESGAEIQVCSQLRGPSRRPLLLLRRDPTGISSMRAGGGSNG